MRYESVPQVMCGPVFGFWVTSLGANYAGKIPSNRFQNRRADHRGAFWDNTTGRLVVKRSTESIARGSFMLHSRPYGGLSGQRYLWSCWHSPCIILSLLSPKRRRVTGTRWPTRRRTSSVTPGFSTRSDDRLVAMLKIDVAPARTSPHLESDLSGSGSIEPNGPGAGAIEWKGR